jgi:DUF4097 and DUF4098 domain-containing protein YvlB
MTGRSTWRSLSPSDPSFGGRRASRHSDAAVASASAATRRVSATSPSRRELKTGIGDITLERAVGRTEVVTGSGAIRIGRIDGIAVVKNSNGDTWIGEVTAEARVSAGNGAIAVDVAREGAVAKSAKGDVRLADVSRGTAVAQSAFGTVEVGVRDGVTAWLELHTRFGHVQNDLETSGSPEQGADTVEVHATTSFGDITIRPSPASRVGGNAS